MGRLRGSCHFIFPVTEKRHQARPRRAARASALASGSAMTPAGDCCICSLQIMLRFEGDILKASGIAEIGGAK